MKHHRFLIALAALPLLLAACAPATPPIEPPQTTPPVQSFVITEKTVIVRSDDSEEAVSAMRNLRDAITEIYGFTPELKTDFVYRGETVGESEILIGVTNREEAGAVYAELGDDQYGYRVLSPSRLLILGKTEMHCVKAVDCFLADFFAYGEAGAKPAPTPLPVAEQTVLHSYEIPFENPILPGYADPDVLYYEGTYYFYATSSFIGNGYEVWSSKDLKTWTNHGNCLASSWGLSRWFWAPDVEEHDGKFYMLCSVDEHLGIAVADSPLGPFKPQNKFLFEATIDGHIYFDGDQMYIYYVSWRAGHQYGIWGCEMKRDCITPDLSTETLLLVASERYETQLAGVVEGPFMLKRDGVYYLTYSGCHYESPDYCVCYATSSSPLGPFKRYRGNPILIGDGKTISGTGHHSFVELEGDEMLIFYHAHAKPGTVHPRNTHVGYARFTQRGGETVIECDKPN